jgi:hypothetical protein
MQNVQNKLTSQTSVDEFNLAVHGCVHSFGKPKSAISSDSTMGMQQIPSYVLLTMHDNNSYYYNMASQSGSLMYDQ